MKKHFTNQTLAENKDRIMQSIKDVPNGLQCGCFCPSCHEALVAKQGATNVWHFAHQSKAECLGAAETALHKAAKQLVVERRGIEVPGENVKASYSLANGTMAYTEASHSAVWMDFDTVEQEVLLEGDCGSIRPDVIGIKESSQVMIEVAVTHFIDDIKKDIIIGMAIPTLEISLDLYAKEAWTWNDLAQTVIDGVENKTWILSPWRDELFKQAYIEAAALQFEQDELRKKIKQEELREKKEREQRLKSQQAAIDARKAKQWPKKYNILGICVHLNKLPFGFTVWSPYNQQANAVIKHAVKKVGGEWMPNYKNWFVKNSSEPCLLKLFDDLEHLLRSNGYQHHALSKQELCNAHKLIHDHLKVASSYQTSC